MNITNLEIKQRVVTNFTPLAALAISIFAASSFFILHDYLLGVSQLVSLVTLLFVFPFLIKKSYYSFAGNLLAFIGMITIMPWLITGGYANTGFMWSSGVYSWGVFYHYKKTCYNLVEFVFVDCRSNCFIFGVGIL